MSEQAIAEDVRTRILQQPDVILEDIDVMRALIAANDRTMGGNIVDLRGVAMERLEARLQRLEETHRSVIAAAYENLAGMAQIHRAVTAILEPHTFEDFLNCLEKDVAGILRVGSVRLVLESLEAPGEDLNSVGDVLVVRQPGFVAEYTATAQTPRQVTLRSSHGNASLVFGEHAEWIGSEACIALDLGAGRLPGMLVMASDDPKQFQATQGTDLLSFLGASFERAMRRWLG